MLMFYFIVESNVYDITMFYVAFAVAVRFMRRRSGLVCCHCRRYIAHPFQASRFLGFSHEETSRACLLVFFRRALIVEASH
jgi:hypothetical protein